MRRRTSGGLALLVLAAAILAVYGPGLTEAPQWDITQYFAERQAWPTFTGGLQRLDYPLARRYWKGDEGQFRPLFFFLLATQYQLFGADIRGYHAVNVGLHLLVAFLLYRLLLLHHPRDMALALSVLFAVLFATVGLVQEPFVGAYLLGYALLLAALRNAWVQLGRTAETRARDWIPFAICLTLAGFCFEVIVVLSIGLALSFVIYLRSRRVPVSPGLAAMWIAPSAVFAALYLPRLLIVPRLFFIHDVADSNLLAAEHLTTYVARAAEFFVRWGATTVLPAVGPLFWSIYRERALPGVAQMFAMLVNVGLLGAIIGVIWKYAHPPLSAEARARLMILAALLAGYVATVRFGRGVTDATHRYLFALLVVLILGTLLQFLQSMGRARLVMMSLLATLAVLNAGLSRDLTSENGREGAAFVRYLSSLDRFVRMHKQEPGFSFYVESHSQLDDVVGFVEGYPDRPISSVNRRLWEVFPGAASNPAAAAYSLTWDGEDLVIRPNRGR